MMSFQKLAPTASFSQVEDLGLLSNVHIQLLDSSFESSYSLPLSVPSNKKNDIQKQTTTTTTYWVSPPEAKKKLFNPLPNDSTMTAIDNEIETIRQANNSSSGYLLLIQNLNHINQEDEITHHHKWNIQQKCQYIVTFSLHQLAKENTNI